MIAITVRDEALAPCYGELDGRVRPRADICFYLYTEQVCQQLQPQR